MDSTKAVDQATQQTVELLGQIASKTNSEVILFAIAVGIMGAIFISIYLLGQRQIRKHELEQQKHDLERQKQSGEREGKLLDIMSETASALKSLKTVIENSTTQSANSITRIHTRIDEVAKSVSSISGGMAVMLKGVTRKSHNTAANGKQ